MHDLKKKKNAGPNLKKTAPNGAKPHTHRQTDGHNGADSVTSSALTFLLLETGIKNILDVCESFHVSVINIKKKYKKK